MNVNTSDIITAVNQATLNDANAKINDWWDSTIPGMSLGYFARNAGLLSPRTITSVARSGSTDTVRSTDHALNTGDSIVIKGARPATYNRTYPVTVIDANSFSITPASSAGTYVSGGTFHVQSGVTWSGMNSLLPTFVGGLEAVRNAVSTIHTSMVPNATQSQKGALFDIAKKGVTTAIAKGTSVLVR